ncbi:serine/threonine-protein kinase PknK [Sandaracinus amylolyticus]|uniref:Serine/threonine-protein kinase PknA n=1 Tax=Sandaracinus amylolyticus TaxID=927083 RepID=A0A0F6YN11_9BACT|nr:protein kinase [Sandaracinus amylolyticus]AKF11388.1 Serine/threonine-protein kinase PknA [Sandaracinus amylolyticus]
MTAPAFAIGPFALHEVLGRGGMGEVWRAVHVAQGVPVAVKVLRGARSIAPRYVAAFRREAERLAALDHPAIVTVLDFGTLSADEARASDGRYVAGSPWIAMELAEGASLAALAPMPWSDVVHVARVLLDALAHAHARGVVHRDLKPANVLVSGCEDGTRADVLLTDFGIAHALDGGEIDDAEIDSDGMVMLAGTPGFMAPEQVRGEWRDFGPWTDLYSLGCTIWTLLAGIEPFAGAAHRVMLAHMTEELPPLPATLEVPDDVRAWIARLARSDLHLRFRRAADAAAALERVAGPRSGRGRAWARRASPSVARTLEVVRTRAASSASTPRAASTVLDAPLTPSPVRQTPPTARTTQRPRSAPPPPKPAFPASWRAERAPLSRMQLVGAGLSLYGAREIPIVDRDVARDALWEALGDVHERRALRVVLLRGASGVGKSRLLRWTLHRAHELGVASTLLATHGPERGVLDGLAPALARHLGCLRLTPDALRARIDALLAIRGEGDALEREALFALLAKVACEPGAAPPGEREATAYALTRALGREARERTLVLGLDDLQWGDETTRLLTNLLRDPDAPPMLVVATVQEEALHVAPETAAAITALEQDAHARALAIGPLGEEDQLSLVQDLLRLEPGLARELVQRTAGNPLFAEQLVGDWVRREILEVRADGFALRAGARVDLPDDLHAVWIARVERLLASRPAVEREALEIAALLGHHVDEAEWTRACELASLPSPRELATALARARLVDLGRDGSGIAFVHGMLRESVLRAAVEAGRRDAQVLVIERLLRERVQAGASDARERLGRLLADTGRDLEAVPLLIDSAHDRRVQSEAATSLALLDLADGCADRAGIADDDPVRGRAWLTRSATLRSIGDYPAALALADRTAARRGVPGWDALAPLALLRRAEVESRIGQIEPARRALTEAHDALLAQGDLINAGQAVWLLGWLDAFTGRLEDALGRFRLIEVFATRQNEPRLSLHLYWAMGFAHLAREDVVEAARVYARAKEIAVAQGSRLALAHVRFGDAALALARGAIDDAIATAEESIALYRSVRSTEQHFAEVVLGMAWARGGRLDLADEVLTRAEESLERHGRHAFAVRVGVVHAAVDAALGRWESARAHLLEGLESASRDGYRETLLAREVIPVIELARAAGREEEARLARELALHHLDLPHTRDERDALAASA